MSHATQDAAAQDRSWEVIVLVVVGLALQLVVISQKLMPIDPVTGKNAAGNYRGTKRGSASGRAAGKVRKGERRHVTHGGKGDPRNSQLWPTMLARVKQVAEEKAPWVLATDQFILEIFVGLLVGCEEMRVYLTANGWLDEDGHERPVVRTYMRALSKAGTEAERLGFTPSARVDLGFKAAATEVAVRPVRSLSRSKEVLSIAASLGLLPRPKAEVIEGTAVEVSEAEYRSTSPKPTPEGLRVPRQPRRVVER
jgi:hypothetical protein